VDFGGEKFAEATVGQRSQLEWPEGDPLKPDDFVTNAGKQTADFAVFAFLKLQFEHRAAALVTDESHTSKSKETLRKVHPFLELLENLRAGATGNMAAISADDFEPGVSKALCEVPVVGEQEQALGVFVKPADGEQPLVSNRNEVDSSSTALRVAVCTKYALGFIEQKVAEARESAAFGVQTNVLIFDGYEPGRIRDNFAVDGDAAIADVLFTVSPGIDA
jgi:hypothetical protein